MQKQNKSTRVLTVLDLPGTNVTRKLPGRLSHLGHQAVDPAQLAQHCGAVQNWLHSPGTKGIYVKGLVNSKYIKC